MHGGYLAQAHKRTGQTSPRIPLVVHHTRGERGQRDLVIGMHTDKT